MSQHKQITSQPASAKTGIIVNEAIPAQEAGEALYEPIKPMPVIQRKCSHCEEEETIQRRPQAASLTPFIQAKGTGVDTATDDLTARIGASRGVNMDRPTQSFMEGRFGADFSAVKIHTGDDAVQMNRELKAQAFTVGNDIYFNSGKYEPGTGIGKHLLAHELTHTVQQSGGDVGIMRQPLPPTQAQLNAQCYQPGVVQPSPSAREPELHPTYERWLASFTGMTTFTSNDTAPGSSGSSFSVLGVEGANYNDTAATAETESVPRVGRAAPADNFIDHPTNQWVQNCLPDNLRATAYQLPADCADIAIILRHVWLAAQHRTETYNGWVVGDTAGRPNQARVRQMIVGDDSVYSGNVEQMVQPYADGSGARLLDFNQLAPMLHPGDILVWRHITATGTGRTRRLKRTGGHTQTINNVQRTGATITGILVLQGNQPVFSADATAILQFQGARDTRGNSPAGHALRDSPGRRIEADTAISISAISHPDESGTQIWGKFDGKDEHGNDTFTLLVAAGPARAARRPAAGRAGRSVLNWSGAVAGAGRGNIHGIIESLITEARSITEGGTIMGTVSVSDMQTLGTETGQRLRHLYRSDAATMAAESSSLASAANAFAADSTNAAAMQPLVTAFTDAMNLALVR